MLKSEIHACLLSGCYRLNLTVIPKFLEGRLLLELKLDFTV